MSKIPDNVRIEIEDIIDTFLESPTTMAENIEKDLMQLGIEPSVDTILSMFNGYILGAMVHLHGGEIEVREFMDPLIPLLARRAWEIRQALLKERMK